MTKINFEKIEEAIFHSPYLNDTKKMIIFYGEIIKEYMNKIY